MTFLLWIVPKIGPFRVLKVRIPTPEVERMFIASFNATVARCKVLLANVDAGQLELPNENFDLGEPTMAGKYKGTDEAYAKLVDKLARKQFAEISPELRQNILEFYQGSNPLISAEATEEERAAGAKLHEQLGLLKALP